MSVALNWQSIRPAVPIGKVSGYFDLPAFSFDSQWLGASVIVAQYNLSLDRNFVLRNRPAKPSNANCLLAIRYRVGSTVYRYKLWEDADCTLVADLYNGQVIKKNCVIEIWNLSTSTNSSQVTAMRLYTGLMQVVTDFSTAPTDYAGATAALQQDQFASNSIYPLPTTNLIAQFDASQGVTLTSPSFMSSWRDVVGGFVLSKAFGFDCGYVASDPLINGKPYIVTDQGLSGPIPLPGGVGTVYAVMQQLVWVLNTTIISATNGPIQWALYQSAVSPEIRGIIGGVNTGVDANVPVGGGLGPYKIVKIVSSGGGSPNLRIRVEDEARRNVVAASGAGAPTWVIGNAACAIAELLCYSGDSGDDSADDIAAKAYLASKYALSYQMPMEFTTSLPWLDNT